MLLSSQTLLSKPDLRSKELPAVTTWALCRRARFVVFVSTLILISLLMSLPLLAAGPAPVQNETSGPRIWLQANQPLPVIHRDRKSVV